MCKNLIHNIIHSKLKRSYKEGRVEVVEDRHRLHLTNNTDPMIILYPNV